MTDFTKATGDAMAALDLIDQAVAKSAGRFDGLRERADEVFEQRVTTLAELHGVDLSKAYALAADDDLAQRAYQISSDLAQRQGDAHDAGGLIAGYVE